MKIILARHGEAEYNSPTGYDKDRHLTDTGVLDIRKMASFIKVSSLKVQHILHSPYTRTRETAEIYAEELGISEVLESCDELAPENDCSDLLCKLKPFSNSETFLLVSHNPGISHFAAQLIQEDSLFQNLPFSPGTTLAINIAREFFRKGQIIWMISPNDLNSELFLQSRV
ncbi:MAG: phosphohistidine phosphatase SixA [Leptospiraceae bacterium]|nr:phosphohistidine phosphatase SixA [Leptospiraceae bacterium]